MKKNEIGEHLQLMIAAFCFKEGEAMTIKIVLRRLHAALIQCKKHDCRSTAYYTTGEKHSSPVNCSLSI